MYKIKINNIDFLVNSNISVLDACQYVGVQVPRFCYHELLSIAGNCRMCLVEIEKSPKPVASCAMPIVNNMSILTDSPLVKKARENVLESILLNHPLDCPICDQGGECDLQDQTKVYGSDYSRFYNSKRVVEDKFYGSFIKTIMTRCIHCTRCVRFSEEITGTPAFGTLNRGGLTEIGSYIQGDIFNSEISGNVIDLCPVGALTSKPYAFKARPWELRCQEGIDFTDGLGANILVNFKESEIVRIQPKYDINLKSSLITDKIRFSFDSLKNNRVQNVYKKIDTKYKHVYWDNVFEDFLFLLEKRKKITFLINESLDIKSIYSLKKLQKFFGELIQIVLVNKKNSETICENQIIRITSIENSKTYILFSTNIRTENALLNTKIRINYNKNAVNIFNLGLTVKNSIPLMLLNISPSNAINFVEGKLEKSFNVIKSKNTVFIIGLSFLKRVTQTRKIIDMFKKICPTGIFFYNYIKPNYNGLKILNIKSINSTIVYNTDVFVCINLDDNILVRKIVSNKIFFWFNSHGSKIALNANYILPLKSFFETDGLFINLENRIQKVYAVINSFKETKNLLEFFDCVILLSNIYIKKQYTSFYLKYLEECLIHSVKSINVPINAKFKFTSFFCLKKNFGLILEDFFLDGVFTKNSNILSKRSQEYRKNFNGFLD